MTGQVRSGVLVCEENHPCLYSIFNSESDDHLCCSVLYESCIKFKTIRLSSSIIVTTATCKCLSKCIFFYLDEYFILNVYFTFSY